MLSDDTKSLSDMRMTHAEECLRSAESLASAGDNKGAVNRAYYAVFHAMRAVLALDDIDMKHHSGIISEFRKRYIKTNIFPDTASDTISQAFDLRSECDYDDFCTVSAKTAEELLLRARDFVRMVGEYLADL